MKRENPAQPKDQAHRIVRRKIGTLVSTEGVLYVFVEMDAKAGQHHKHECDHVIPPVYRKTGAAGDSHQDEIADWVVGLPEAADNNSLPVNPIYLGVLDWSGEDGKPMLPRDHALNRGIVHGKLDGNTITITDSIPHCNSAIRRGKHILLVPLNRFRVHLFGDVGTGKSEAIKSLNAWMSPSDPTPADAKQTRSGKRRK